MTFDSTIFLFAFLPISFILYYVTPTKFKNLALVVISVFFYLWTGVVHTLILLASVVWNYAGGLFVEKQLKHTKRVKNIVMVIAGVDIALLVLCKYLGELLGMTGNRLADSRYFLVPIGISFFMLQNIAYIIDIYRGDIRAQKEFAKYAAMIVMFPKITAGPLVAGSEFEKQLNRPRLSLGRCSDGILLFIRGLSKNVILGSAMGMAFETVQALPAERMSVLSAWLGCGAFALQIYFIYGGYCDMAAGLGRMLGFELPENVNYPCLSTGIMDFWSRWMSTLWKWFCSYVYLPLCCGNPAGGKGFLSLLLTWLLIGLWHGMNLKFIFWGVYFALLLYLEGFVLGERFAKIPKFFRWILTSVLLMISWVFCFSPSLGEAFSYIRFMIIGGGAGFIDAGALSVITDYGVLWAAAALFSTPLASSIYGKVIGGGRKWQIVLNSVVYVLLFIVCVAGVVSKSGNGFLYF